MDLGQQQTLSTSSELPIYWLGEFVFATVSKGMENIIDTVQNVMRRWSIDFIVRRLLSVMVIVNPRLSAPQQARLTAIMSRALDQLLWQRSLDLRVLRSIVALACPNQDTGLLFGYLMEVIAGLACGTCHSHDFLEVKSTQLDLEASVLNLEQVVLEEVTIVQTFLQLFCVEQVYVAAMPSQVRKAVLGALNGGADLVTQTSDGIALQSHQSSPICCITLEPLLSQDRSVTTDVVAVIQRSSTSCKQHAFLYRGQALYDWLGASSVPTNPETRSLVRPTDIYRLS